MVINLYIQSRRPLELIQMTCAAIGDVIASFVVSRFSDSGVTFWQNQAVASPNNCTENPTATLRPEGQAGTGHRHQLELELSVRTCQRDSSDSRSLLYEYGSQIIIRHVTWR